MSPAAPWGDSPPPPPTLIPHAPFLSAFVDRAGARGTEAGDQAPGDRGDPVAAGARIPDQQPAGGPPRRGEPAAACQD